MVPTVENRKSRWLVLAISLVLLAGCYRKNDYVLTSEDLDGIFVLESVTGALSLPADGYSELQFVARILSAAEEDRRSVVFTTTDGSFDPVEDLQTVTVDTDADGNAYVVLRSSVNMGNVTIQAQVAGVPVVLQKLEIDFAPVVANNVIWFVAAPSSAPADGFTTSAFTVRIAEDLPTDKRKVTFKTTAGTFTVSGSAEAEVDASFNSQITVYLTSPTDVGIAAVTATVNGVSTQTTVEFKAVDANEIIKFVGSLDPAPADGATRSPVTVKVSSKIPAEDAVVEFTTTAGTFAISGSNAETVVVTANSRATAELVSPTQIGSARISASIKNKTQEKAISFYRALPDKAIEVRIDPVRIVLDPDAQATVVTTLVRNVGTPTAGTKVFYQAYEFGPEDEDSPCNRHAIGNVVGHFSNATLSDGVGQSLASFVLPSTTSYRGDVRILAYADGVGLTGCTRATLSNPPP